MSRVPRLGRSSPLRGRTIGFIGAGTMGQALLRCLVVQGVKPRSIVAADPRPAARRRASALGVRTTDENCEVGCEAEVIVLAVKPQEIPSALGEIADCVRRRRPRPLVISIAAGITLRYLERRLPGVPVVRVMPNLPATVQAGFAAYAPGRSARLHHRRVARAIFEAAGDVAEVPERLLDVVTAVSGSGPAYVFFLARAWEGAACALGLPRALAQQAVRKTLKGSVKLLASETLSPEAWIARVASKGGTTEAALKVLAKRRVSAHLIEALRAAAKRARALSWSEGGTRGDTRP